MGDENTIGGSGSKTRKFSEAFKRMEQLFKGEAIDGAATSPPEDPKATDQASSGQESPSYPTRRSASILMVVAMGIGVFIVLYGYFTVKKPIDSLARVLIVAIYFLLGAMAAYSGFPQDHGAEARAREGPESFFFQAHCRDYHGVGIILLASGINYTIIRGIGISRIGLLMMGTALILGPMFLVKWLR